jgi:hypothetical protein
VCQRVQLSDWSGIHEVLLPKPPKAELSVWESGVNAWFPLASKFFRVRGCPWGARPRAPGNDYVAAREGPSGLLQELGATGELRAFPGPLQEPGLGIFACGALPGPLHGSGPCKLDPTRRTSRLLGEATPRPRIPGKSRRAAAQGACRGSRASFAVGVHPFYSARRPATISKSHFWWGPLRGPHENYLPLARRSDPSSPVPDEYPPKGVCRGSRVSFAVGVHRFYSARRGGY